MRYARTFAIWFLLALGSAPGARAIQPNERAEASDATWKQSGEPRVSEERTFAGVPVHILRPAAISADCRLIVLFHGYGSPASPQELARALPLAGMNAVLAYVNLPMVAGRLPAGGIEELRRLQKENFVNGFFFPSISGAAGELHPIVAAIASAYHLDTRRGIGLFGFSAGGAAALLSLLESDVPVCAAVIVNAPLSVAQNVENWEHTLGLHFQWDEASRQAALRYDPEREAGKIAERQPLPALLLLQGEADKSLGLEPARRAYERLRSAYAARGEAARVELKIFPGLGHQFGPDAKTTPSEPASDATELEALIEQWFQKFLVAF